VFAPIGGFVLSNTTDAKAIGALEASSTTDPRIV